MDVSAPIERRQQVHKSASVEERKGEAARIERVNAERASRRGYIVFATDPDIAPDEPDYRATFVTEAKTLNQAVAKVRPLAEGRRLSAYLMTGRYRDEFPEARWVD